MRRSLRALARGSILAACGSSEDVGICGVMPYSGRAHNRVLHTQMPTIGAMIDCRTGSSNVESVVWNQRSEYVYLRAEERGLKVGEQAGVVPQQESGQNGQQGRQVRPIYISQMSTHRETFALRTAL